MEALLRAYLKHTGHHLVGNDIWGVVKGDYNDNLQDVLAVIVKNNCVPQGFEIVTVTVEDLLVFLFERQA